MKITNIKCMLFTLTLFIALVGCNDQWDEHVEVTNPALSGTVLEALEMQPNLSAFYKMVVETGCDALLASDNVFTVLAPDNAALTAYVSSDKEMKTAIVKNHIAYLSYNASALSGMDKLTMMTGKNLKMSGFTINTSNDDILCGNGIIHEVNKAVVPDMNIYEYISAIKQGTYIQLDSLLGQTVKVMDAEKSVQTGVNEEGKSVYDTVWTYQNHFFDKMAIANEDSLYTFVLIDNNDFKAITGKYAKYMQQSSPQKTDSLIVDELITDLVFRENADVAISGVKVDFSKAVTVTEYEASNGIVRIMKGVDVKLKENKIKTIYVEGEDLRAALNAKYLTRLRPWASGGKDVMLSANSQQLRDSLDSEGNKVMNGTTAITIPYTFRYETSGAADSFSNDINFYMEYGVKVNSADYDIHWVSYDDLPSHVGTDGYPESTLNLQQKLFISLPGEPVLKRESTGQIVNNYLGGTTAFVGSTLAGVHKEVQLKKYTLGTTVASFLVSEVEDEEDPLLPYTFTSPTMGEAVLWVCNTTKYSGTYSGMMFLDYIRLVPRIDEGD